MNQNKLKRHDGKTQCGILDWVLEGKKEDCGKTSKIRIKPVV